MSDIYRLNDFLFHIGNYNYRIISAIPEKTTDIATMIKPYDVYIRILIGISTIAVMLTMIAIEIITGVYMEEYVRSSIHQCKRTNSCICSCNSVSIIPFFVY